MKNTYSQKGFSLLEALLTTAILSGLFVVIFGLLQNYTEQMVAKSAANYMDKIRVAVIDILKNPNNYHLIYNEVDAQGNDVLEITINDILTGEIGGISLPDTGVLNNNIGAGTPLKTNISIMIRRPGNDALEVIIATNDRVDDKRIRRAAEFSKLNGGFYRNTVDDVKNAYNAWTFDPAVNLAGTTWWTNFANPNPPSINNGSYLLNYEHISFDEVAGDYLYRLRTNGRPELNTLYTDLNMGGQNITGADNINLSGNLDLESSAFVNGSVSVNENITLNASNLRAFNTLSTQNATMNNAPGGVTGNFTVQGTLNTNDLNIDNAAKSGQATFSSGFSTAGSISVDSVETDRIESDSLNVTQLGGASANDRMGIYIDGGLSASIIETPELIVFGGRNPISEQLTVNGNMSVGNEINAPEFNIDNLNTNIFGACDSGAC